MNKKIEDALWTLAAALVLALILLLGFTRG